MQIKLRGIGHSNSGSDHPNPTTPQSHPAVTPSTDLLPSQPPGHFGDVAPGSYALALGDTMSAILDAVDVEVAAGKDVPLIELSQ